MPIVRAVLFALLAMAVVPGFLMTNDAYSGCPAARAEFERGKVASQSEDWKAAVAAYKKAIQLDPNFADAHQEYMFARVRLAMGDLSGLGGQSKAERKKISERVKRDGDNVTKEYENLARLHPHMPIYLWALAQQYNESNPTLEE